MGMNEIQQLERAVAAVQDKLTLLRERPNDAQVMISVGELIALYVVELDTFESQLTFAKHMARFATEEPAGEVEEPAGEVEEAPKLAVPPRMANDVNRLHLDG
jgi:hypothetical protein